MTFFICGVADVVEIIDAKSFLTDRASSACDTTICILFFARLVCEITD